MLYIFRIILNMSKTTDKAALCRRDYNHDNYPEAILCLNYPTPEHPNFKTIYSWRPFATEFVLLREEHIRTTERGLLTDVTYYRVHSGYTDSYGHVDNVRTATFNSLANATDEYYKVCKDLEDFYLR